MFQYNPYGYGYGGVGYIPTRAVTPIRPSTQTTQTRQSPYGNRGDVSGGSQSQSQASIEGVNNPIGRNMGLASFMLGMASGVPGLGTIGSAVQTGAETQAYSGAIPGFDPSFGSALANNLSFGLLGTSVHDQAAKFARDNAPVSSGDPTLFGGTYAGRMTEQAKQQGRGGAVNAGGYGGGRGGYGNAGFGGGYGGQSPSGF